MSSMPQPSEGMQIQVEQTLERRTRFSWNIKDGWIARWLVLPILILFAVF